MEFKSVAVLLVAVCLFALSSAMSLPSPGLNKDLDMDVNPDSNDLDERATWLDTRALRDQFKELAYAALVDLENEGRITKVTVDDASAKTKRGRYQGFCFRRTRNGRFLPYICWKGDRK